MSGEDRPCDFATCDGNCDYDGPDDPADRIVARSHQLRECGLCGALVDRTPGVGWRHVDHTDCRWGHPSRPGVHLRQT